MGKVKLKLVFDLINTNVLEAISIKNAILYACLKPKNTAKGNTNSAFSNKRNFTYCLSVNIDFKKTFLFFDDNNVVQLIAKIE